jgi:hypothetical protein
MKRFLHPIVFLLALLIIFEEWLWDALKAQVQRLSRLPMVAAFENRLRRLGPKCSLLVLLLPASVLFPCKLAALWAMSHHHPMLGIAVLFTAKIVGTSVAAYIFDIVRDSARGLAWFDRLYGSIIALLTRVKVWLAAQPTYQKAREAVTNLRCMARRLTVIRGRSRLKRKFTAACALVYCRPLPGGRVAHVSPDGTWVSGEQLSKPPANDTDLNDVWAIWPNGYMCPSGLELFAELQSPSGRGHGYVLVKVLAYDQAGAPSSWRERLTRGQAARTFNLEARRRARARVS